MISLLLFSLFSHAQLSESGGTPSDLDLKSSGVPSFPLFYKEDGQWKKTLEVPELKVGREVDLSFELKEQSFPKWQKVDFQSQELLKEHSVEPTVHAPKFQLVDKNSPNPQQFQREDIRWTVLAENSIQLLPTLNWTADNDLLLNTLIRYQIKKDLPAALAGFIHLRKKKIDGANYFIGDIADQLGLKELSKSAFISALKSPHFISAAQGRISKLSYPLPSELIEPLLKVPHPAPENIDLNNIMYSVGKRHFDRGQFDKAIAWFQRVNSNYRLSADNQIHLAIAFYQTGQSQLAIETLKPELHPLARISLARIYAQSNQPLLSIQTYRQISMDNPFWLDAVLEAAWVQLQMNDNAGAIGNMLSLNAGYFDRSLHLDAGIIKTIGYIRECQYGDAKASLEQMTAQLQDIQTQFSESSIKLYPMVQRMIRATAKESDMTEGLLVELARQPEFLTIQKSINQIERERKIEVLGQVKATRKSLMQDVEKLKASLQSFQDVDINSDSYSALSKKRLLADLGHAKDRYKRFKKSEELLKVNFQKYHKFLLKRKGRLKLAAERELQRQLEQLETQVEFHLSQSEILRYEIFDRAGEHLRLKLGQVDLGQETPDSRQNGAIRWNYEEEIWLDEVGHFRSQLPNQCPKEKS